LAGREEVEVKVTARSEGEEVYGRHKEGMEELKEAQKDARMEMAATNLETMATLESLSALQSGVSGLSTGFRYFAGENEALNEAMEGLNAAMATAIGIMQIAKGASALLAMTKWGEAAANIAAAGWAAPILAAVIGTALATFAAVKIQSMATGGTGIAYEPTLFMAGDRGPEAYSFVPLGAGSPLQASMGRTSIDAVNITVISPDPERAGESVATHLRRLEGAGR
jgi:hypothetical protein